MFNDTFFDGDPNLFNNLKNLNLKSVTLDAGLTHIGPGAFHDCKLLEEITFKGNTPPNIGYNYTLEGIVHYVHSFGELELSITSPSINTPNCNLYREIFEKEFSDPDVFFDCGQSNTIIVSDAVDFTVNADLFPMANTYTEQPKI